VTHEATNASLLPPKHALKLGQSYRLVLLLANIAAKRRYRATGENKRGKQEENYQFNSKPFRDGEN